MQVLRRARGRLVGRPAPAVPPQAQSSATTRLARPPASAGLVRAFGALAVPDFRTFWFGTFFSMAAIQMDVVSRPWLAYHLSGSGLTLGLVALARGLPMLIFTLVGGVAADRFDKRKLLVISQSALSILALGNAVLVHTGTVQIWHLVVLGVLQGAISPFTVPARQAYVPELVKPAQLPNAIAMTSTGMNLNRVLAPVVAGILIAWNPAIAFYAIAVFYSGAALSLVRLSPSRTRVGKHEGALAEITIGFRYIWNQPVLRMLIGMAFIPVLLGMPFQQLLPVFQADVLHVGPRQLGFMYTAVGIGSLVGSLSVAYFSESPRKVLTQLIAGIGFGVSLVLFALSTAYAVSLAVLVAVGFASQGYMTLNNVLMMLHTEKALYGRVISVYMITWSLMPLSMLPMGALVDAVGAPATLAGAGALLACSIVLVGVLYPSHWRPATAGIPVGPNPGLGERGPERS